MCMQVVREGEMAELRAGIGSLGLFDDRIKGLIAITEAFLLGDDAFAVDLKEHKIRGIGEFGYHSWLIFCRDQGGILKANDAALASFCNWRKKNPRAEAVETPAEAVETPAAADDVIADGRSPRACVKAEEEEENTGAGEDDRPLSMRAAELKRKRTAEPVVDRSATVAPKAEPAAEGSGEAEQAEQAGQENRGQRALRRKTSRK
jgi:hypothetical protein